jgi:hypothetical protein
MFPFTSVAVPTAKQEWLSIELIFGLYGSWISQFILLFNLLTPSSWWISIPQHSHTRVDMCWFTHQKYLWLYIMSAIPAFWTNCPSSNPFGWSIVTVNSVYPKWNPSSFFKNLLPLKNVHFHLWYGVAAFVINFGIIVPYFLFSH